MTDRVKEIFSVLPNCNVFADIGCDHGYLAKAMLKSGKCNFAIVSDISKKCLEKAERLLYDYINGGKARSAVSDGFDNVGSCDLALIAGMGGEEIIKILQKAQNLPDKLALQPMKNVDKVRAFVVSAGYKIILDYVFKAEGKFYDMLLLEKGEDELSEDEKIFGRDNLKSPSNAFVERLNVEIFKAEKLVADENINDATKKILAVKIQRMKKYV